MPGFPTKEWFEKEARAHLRTGDLFDFKNPVIPVMTNGRVYGSISQQVLKRGAVIPDLEHTNAVFVDPYIFVALWDSEGAYNEKDIFDCAAICLNIASHNHMPQLVMPVLGGKEGMQWLWAMERGIFEHSDFLHEAGLFIPDHIYITDKTLT